MTQEEKQLLLVDLSSRLPYGVKGVITHNDDKNIFTIKGIFHILFLSDTNCCRVEDFKPYLFPLSSMTEEQRAEYQYITERWMYDSSYSIGDSVDWLNKNHFDYRGLISAGAAIDATGLNIY